jgi:hypothetical protein
LTTRKTSRTFRVVAREGALKSGAKFRGAKRIRLIVRDAAGDVVVRKWVFSGGTVARFVDAGKYRITLRGRGGTRFTLRVVRTVSQEMWKVARGVS